MRKRALRMLGLGLDWGTNLALVVILVAIIAVLVAPHVMGWRYGILRSGSMSPAMPAGAAIVVAPADVADLHPGDVITFRSSLKKGLLTTHRIYDLASDTSGNTAFVTKGDANEEPDGGMVTRERVMGKVVFSLPEVGRIANRLHTRTGFFILIALPTALIIAIELRELAEGIKDLAKNRKKAEA